MSKLGTEVWQLDNLFHFIFPRQQYCLVGPKQNLVWAATGGGGIPPLSKTHSCLYNQPSTRAANYSHLYWSLDSSQNLSFRCMMVNINSTSVKGIYVLVPQKFNLQNITDMRQQRHIYQMKIAFSFDPKFCYFFTSLKTCPEQS